MSPAVMRPTVDFDHSILEGMRRIPIYLVTGERDRLIPVRVIRQWADKMRKLQMNYKYEEIKGGNHFNSITRNAELVGRIYDFFDNVKVNEENEDLRKNRLELINMLCKTFQNFMNFQLLKANNE